MKLMSYAGYFALGMVGLVESVSGDGLPSLPLPGSTAPAVWKNEIKLLVTAENAQQAIKALKLNEHRDEKQIVCFFDTNDRLLEANNLILRVREQEDGGGESTVKLRALDGATELSNAEQVIRPEEDWTSENKHTFSRSVDCDSLAKGLVSKVIKGQAAVIDLFNEAQRKIVAARLKDFQWESLKLYGPVEAQVWRQQWKFYGFPKEVTVELWHLQQDGRTQDILEVSSKAKADSEAQAQTLAKQFFEAAKAAGLGESLGETKTRKVLDFFKPGR